MATLSTQLRCNRCGTKLPDEPVPCCPRCGVELSQAGTWSEVKEWGTTRQLGRGRFIRRSVLQWGLITLVQCAAYAYRGETDPGVYASTTVWLAGGYVFGRWYWWWAERDFAARQTGRTAPPHPPNQG
jgi:hypothetical protein